ncbi:MAG: copper amine oxidase N-terminal domain-containing protein [Ignavibacteriales bacterium]
MSRRLPGTLTTLVLAMSLILSTTGAGLGAPADGSVLLTLSGNALSTTGVIRYEVTMVPLDSLAADLGIETRSAYEDRILVSRGKYKVDLGVGSSMAVVNGHEIRGIVPPTKENGQIMVPLRFLLENMGYDVAWQDGPQGTADIRPIEENDIIIGTVRGV